MGRTKIDIDAELVEKVRRLTGARSKREAVDITLRRLVQKGPCIAPFAGSGAGLPGKATSTPGVGQVILFDREESA